VPGVDCHPHAARRVGVHAWALSSTAATACRARCSFRRFRNRNDPFAGSHRCDLGDQQAVDEMKLADPDIASPRAAGKYTVGVPMWMWVNGASPPSSREGSHLPALTDPYVTVARHTALVVLVTSPGGRGWSRPSGRRTRAVVRRLGSRLWGANSAVRLVSRAFDCAAGIFIRRCRGTRESVRRGCRGAGCGVPGTV